MGRLQKEKDSALEECEKLQERLDVQQGHISKAQRDRENMQTEVEMIKERWDKNNQIHQKLQVNLFLNF